MRSSSTTTLGWPRNKTKNSRAGPEIRSVLSLSLFDLGTPVVLFLPERSPRTEGTHPVTRRLKLGRGLADNDAATPDVSSPRGGRVPSRGGARGAGTARWPRRGSHTAPGVGRSRGPTRVIQRRSRSGHLAVVGSADRGRAPTDVSRRRGRGRIGSPVRFAGSRLASSADVLGDAVGR